MYCWDWLDWDSFLPQWFKPIPGILQFQHFKVSKTDKYHVECCKSPTAEPTLIRIVKDNVGLPENSCNLPPVLPAKGFNKKRGDYLTHLAPATFLNVIRNHDIPPVTLGNVIEVHETYMPGGASAFCLVGLKPVRDTCNMSWYSLRQKNRFRTVHRSCNGTDFRR